MNEQVLQEYRKLTDALPENPTPEQNKAVNDFMIKNGLIDNGLNEVYEHDGYADSATDVSQSDSSGK